MITGKKLTASIAGALMLLTVPSAAKAMELQAPDGHVHQHECCEKEAGPDMTRIKTPGGSIVLMVTQRQPEAFINVTLIKEIFYDGDGNGVLGNCNKDFFQREIYRENGSIIKNVYRANSMRHYALSAQGAIEESFYDFTTPSDDPRWADALTQKRTIFPAACAEYGERHE